MSFIIINSRRSSDMGLRLVSVDYGAYERRYVEKTVPYRDGSVVFDQGTYSDREVSYVFETAEHHTFDALESSIEDAMKWLVDVAETKEVFDSSAGVTLTNCRLSSAPSVSYGNIPQAEVAVTFKTDPFFTEGYHG